MTIVELMWEVQKAYFPEIKEPVTLVVLLKLLLEKGK